MASKKMGRPKMGDGFDCLYTAGVECQTRSKCIACGHNPAVHQARAELVRERIAEMQKEENMLRITFQVDAPAGQAIGIKEHIAMQLEKYGSDVRCVDVQEITAEQTRIDMRGRVEQ